MQATLSLSWDTPLPFLLFLFLLFYLLFVFRVTRAHSENRSRLRYHLMDANPFAVTVFPSGG